MVLVRQAFDIFIILFVLGFCACDNSNSQSHDMQTQAYLAQFQKAVLTVQFIQSEKNPKETILLFNQPMVAFDAMNQVKSALEGVELSPHMQGEWEWIEPQILVFRRKEPVLTKTILTVAAGKQSLLGTGLLRDVVFEIPVSQSTFSSLKNDQIDFPERPLDVDRIQWPRDSQVAAQDNVPAVLDVQWDVPMILNLGDQWNAHLQIRNASQKKFSGKVSVESENIISPLTVDLELLSGAEITVPIALQVRNELQTEILQNFLDHNIAYLEKPMVVTFERTSAQLASVSNEGRNSQRLQKMLKIYSTLDFESKDYLGVLATAQKQTLLNESFLRLQTGQLSIDFSLDSHEFLNSLVQGLKEAPQDDLITQAMSLSPYVVFPKSTLAFGEEASLWQSHLEAVQQFLNDLQASLKFQIGRVFSTAQLLRFGEFVKLAGEAGFAVGDLKGDLANLLSQDLADETESNKKVAILFVLQNLGVERVENYAELYLLWRDLDATAQMQLAEMLLKMNPLHPVSKLAKRSIDKILFNETQQPVTFWSQAFRTLVLINPDDSLNFEIFAKVFSNLQNQRSYTNDYAAMLAFQMYQTKFTKLDKPVDLNVTLNEHEIMKAHLSWKNRNDGLILPIEKLPQHVLLKAQKDSGPFAFYRLHLKGLRQVSNLPIEDTGIRVTQTCYDQAGLPQVDFSINKLSTCRVRWINTQTQASVKFEIPILTGATQLTADRPAQAVVALQDTKIKLYFPELASGYGEFDYSFRPKYAGQHDAKSIVVTTTLGEGWSGRFKVQGGTVN